ncbi:response regulator [bacterium]|nr:response regulator [bacterium]
MRILIVEDEVTSREILKEFLSPYGECDLVTDGDEAIELCERAYASNCRYDLIMMDIMMPRVSGHEATRKIREIEKRYGVARHDQVIIIMTTALGDQKNIVEAFFQGGAASYIVKPVEKETLYEELRKLGLIH